MEEKQNGRTIKKNLRPLFILTEKSADKDFDLIALTAHKFWLCHNTLNWAANSFALMWMLYRKCNEGNFIPQYNTLTCKKLLVL